MSSTNELSSPILLALDPSITAFGWCAVALEPVRPCLVDAGVIETKPYPAKRRKAENISVAEDDARRVRWIRRELARVFAAHRPVLAAVEVSFGSQGAKAAKALGAAQALAACVVAEHLNGRAVYVTVHEAGDAIGIARTQRTQGGKTDSERAESSKARKLAIARAVVERLGHTAWSRALGGTDSVLHPRYEGAHDAAAVALAALERPEVAAIRRMAGAA